ncbi:HNH endonuclease [Janibacter melonis]|uniref:HNH endonuclease n=1 Tax=Janibacter melonis TaxID=262209 RepID=A0A650GDG4_9MICO|nr:HNH endonuclease [Janibacter melonis]QGX08246.1 HNH endonuclease [Janibacter melonis]
MATPRGTSHQTRQRNKALLAASSGICHLCGHPGADCMDHVVPLYLDGEDEPHNMRPAHHFAECETCGVKCNRAKGRRRVAPVIRSSGSLRS